jgi:glycosyltransferase involved in cell wall biosynthesis
VSPSPPVGPRAGKQLPQTNVLVMPYWDPRHAEAPSDTGPSHPPYRIDHLSSGRLVVSMSDAAFRPPWTWPPISRLLKAGGFRAMVILRTLLATRRFLRNDIALFVFEREAIPTLWLRSLRIWPFTRPRIAVLAVWLVDVIAQASPRKVRRYRKLFRHVDVLICLSSNQRQLLQEQLGISRDRIEVVHYGVDTDFFVPEDGLEDVDVVAVGHDRGRDWPVLMDAIRHSNVSVRIVCEPERLDGLDVPPTVEAVGTVDRTTYRDLLRRARVVCVPTRDVPYPTGQSVALEAMAMTKCVVLTQTDATREYYEVDGGLGVLVPPGDARRLRDALVMAISDPDRRCAIGQRAAAAVQTRFSARKMWGDVGRILEGIVHRDVVADRAAARTDR